MTADQVREVNALNAVEVELIDERLGGSWRASIGRLGDDVDVIFTSDHGELQATSVCSSRVPITSTSDASTADLAPARSSEPAPSVVHAPVSLVSLAATFLEIAGEPRRRGSRARPYRSTTMTQAPIVRGHVHRMGLVDLWCRRARANVVTDDYLYTEYQPGSVHAGSEGELYVL